jgi:hypothetical protein
MHGRILSTAQHTLPSPYSSLEDILNSEKPTNRVIRWMWCLIYFLSAPWFGVVFCTMGVDPRHSGGTPVLLRLWNVLSVPLIFLLSPITYLVTVVLVLVGVLYRLLLDEQELIFGPRQGRYVVLQTVTDYMLCA